MMENGKPRKRRQLTPQEKWEIFLEVTSQELSQSDAARKWARNVARVVAWDGRAAGVSGRCLRRRFEGIDNRSQRLSPR